MCWCGTVIRFVPGVNWHHAIGLGVPALLRCAPNPMTITDRQLEIWWALRGQRLRAIREYRGYNQTQMADLIELRYGRTDYTKWETGAKRMDTDVAYRLCIVLGMTANYLLAGEVDDQMVRLTDPKFCAGLLRRPELGLSDLRSARRPGYPPA